MARRRKSPIEGLLTLVARAPWPVGVVLAVVSFIVLNQIAQGEPIQGTSTADISRVLFSNIGITLAGIGQYLLPGIFLVAALGSFLRSRKNARIYAAAAAEPVHGVADLSWREFERLIGQVEQPSYQVYIVLNVLQDAGLVDNPERGSYRATKKAATMDIGALWANIEQETT